MSRFIIQGRKAISGTHAVPGNKNAALPMLAATLLTDEPVTLTNIPLIADVRVMIDLLRTTGANVTVDDVTRTVTVHAKRIRSTRLDKTLCSRVRTSILFAGPLLARRGTVTLFPPGGDVIGRRRIDTHCDGFRTLGAKVVIGRAHYAFSRTKRLQGAYVLLDEASVTATENIIMAAVLAAGETVIYNAACEPHVQNLCALLVAMGAKIAGIGTNRLIITGVEAVHGATYRVGSDAIEAASYLTAALVTGGDLTLTNVDTDDFAVIGKPFRRFGARFTLDSATQTVRIPGRQRLKTTYDLGDAIPKIEDGPWPMIPSDLISLLIVLATQTRGTTLFFEKMFESRMYFVDHLIGMGAKIVQCDPHRVVVTGATQLNGGMVASPDIRAGMALLIAALCAKHETIIHNASSIDRGYEAVEIQLAALGASIIRAD